MKMKKNPAGLEPADHLIPRKLKEYYDSIQEEGIPDKFLDLLERLDAAEKAALRNARSGSK